MRGIVSLVASLALPTTVEGSVFPYRDLILFLAFSLILFTLVVQVPTLPLLIGKMGMTGDMRTGEEEIARLAAAQAATDEIDRIAEAGLLPEMELDKLRLEFAAHLRAARDSGTSGLRRSDLREVKVGIIERERAALLAMRRSRLVGDEVLQTLVRELDLAEIAIRRD